MSNQFSFFFLFCSEVQVYLYKLLSDQYFAAHQAYSNEDQP